MIVLILLTELILFLLLTPSEFISQSDFLEGQPNIPCPKFRLL